MTVLDMPCDGRVTFRRFGVRALHATLLADNARWMEPPEGAWTREFNEQLITTYLRPAGYILRGLGR